MTARRAAETVTITRDDEDQDVKICPVCGEEIDIDDDGCPDEGDVTAYLPM